MRSHTTERFRKAFQTLPEKVQRQARGAFRKWEVNPHYPSLRFKKVHASKSIYSVRVSRDFRSVRIRERDQMIWFWIGSHDDYENLISHL